MADEIKFAFDKGETLYARVFNSTGQVWNTSGTPAFEDWADGNVTDYDTSLTDKSSGQYIGNFPVTAAGRFKVNIYEQSGGSPAITDIVVGTGEMLWDGSSEIFGADEDDVSSAHATTDALIVSTFTNVFNIYDES
jgi:hypothetical protein